MENNIQNINKLAKMFGTDRLISTEEIKEVLLGITQILNSYKQGTEKINKETIETVNDLYSVIESQHEKMLSKVENNDENIRQRIAETNSLVEEVKKLAESIQKTASSLKDGKDADEEKIVEEVLSKIKLPENKEFILDGEAIIDKINELSLVDDNKIDWARIKNAPSIKGKTMHTPTVLRDAVDLDGSTRVNGYKISWDATRGLYTHTADIGGAPGGSNTQLQYNNNGVFGGITGATTNGTFVTLTSPALITPTLSGFTTGSVLFAGASGLISQDNANLFYDDTNNRLGIGTATPSYPLSVSGNAWINNQLFIGNTQALPYAGIAASSNGLTLNNSQNGGTNGRTIFTSNATELARVDGGGNWGFLTNAPTHTHTHSSASTGVTLYNTVDQITNFERVRQYWTGNVFNIFSEKAGTGTLRRIFVGATEGRYLEFGFGSPMFNFVSGTTSGANNITTSSTHNASSGTQTVFSLTPTINQSSTAGYTALLVNPTETTTGSGTKLLADFQVGGSSKLKILNTGSVVIDNNGGGGSALTFTDSNTYGEIQTFNNKPLIINRQGNNVGFGTTNVTAVVTIKAGTSTASTAPLKFTAGTNLTTPETGAMEYDGTNLFFTRSGTTRESILTGVSGATAPTTGTVGVLTNYYGASATTTLNAPNSWASVVIAGVTYKIPLFT